MMEKREDYIRSKIITVGEVFDILNAFKVPTSRNAVLMIVRYAKPRKTFKYAMSRTFAYIKAFFPALIYTVQQKLNIKGRYSK